MAENENDNETGNRVSIDDIQKPDEQLSSDEMKDIAGGAKPDEKAGVRGSILWA